MVKAPPPPGEKSKPKAKAAALPKVPASANQPKAASKQKQKEVIKTFQVGVWTGAGTGEKIIGYADSGMGKTSLSMLLPNPVFFGLDDGGRKMIHPVTGESPNFIEGVETFSDFRQATQQYDLFDDHETVVVDTGTVLENMALDWMLKNVPNGEGNYMPNIEKYGWGKGHRHLYDTMRLPLADFDGLIRRGKNVVIMCQMQQIEATNTGGENFLCDAPKMACKHGKQTPSVWGMWTEWCDHVFKIGYSGMAVNEKKKATSSTERQIYLHGQVSFKAKSRTVPGDFPLVAFSDITDDSIWQFIFNEAWRDLLEGE
ncbi:hypothetical protein LCGC14_0720090 [marine sediment metagenome]|uniref:Uncharacterized protein n=1 Tax=marine sediment metagenome TaxID=412755 RepID=A0A0F9TK62_9ZZZZ